MRRWRWMIGTVLMAASAALPADGQGEAPSGEDCLLCHGNPEIQRESPAPGQAASVFIDEQSLKASVHSRFDCTVCHDGVAAPHERIPIPGIETCAACHRRASADFESGVHARLSRDDAGTVTACSGCHGPVHAILPASDPKAPTYALNLPDTCGRCHGDGEASSSQATGKSVYGPYHDSIHGRAVTQSGLLVGAQCVSCHGAHDIRSPADPASRVHRSRIPQTCGACHAGVLPVYRESVHGRLFLAGLYGAPVCTDCHTAHEIRGVEVPAWKLAIVKECGTCHSESLETFRDTYHGQVSSLGYTRAARCSDCHGFHDIQPSRDSRSRTNPANLVATCGRCHEGATVLFTRFDPHADPTNRDRNPVLYYTGRFMTMLLLGVFAFFGMHTALWAVRAWIEKAKGKGHGRPAAGPKTRGPYYTRFRPGQRIMHAVLIVSFLGIALTGLPLLYSRAEWAAALAHALGGFGAMGVLHRFFAVVLTIQFLYHLGQILYWVGIKKDWGVLWGPDSLMPRPRDIADLVRNFLWFLGLAEKPRFGRFTYWEKFDYLAVFWGMPVIGITGYVLWFHGFFANFLPGWWFNVAQLIHGEEALLATAFIFAIHYFNTHLRPEKFPMDLVIFTGSVGETELREERPEQYEALLRRGTLGSIRTEPPRAAVKTLGWIFGGIAVAVGLALLALILSAVFFM